jgi:hypothetical protein
MCFRSDRNNTKFFRVGRRYSEKNKWGQTVPLWQALDEIAKHKIIIFGDFHANNHVVEMLAHV